MGNADPLVMPTGGPNRVKHTVGAAHNRRIAHQAAFVHRRRQQRTIPIQRSPVNSFGGMGQMKPIFPVSLEVAEQVMVRVERGC